MHNCHAFSYETYANTQLRQCAWLIACPMQASIAVDNTRYLIMHADIAESSGVTDLLLGVWGVVRVYEGYRVVEHGALKLLYSICVRVCTTTLRVRAALSHGARGR